MSLRNHLPSGGQGQGYKWKDYYIGGQISLKRDT